MGVEGKGGRVLSFAGGSVTRERVKKERYRIGVFVVFGGVKYPEVT